MRLLVVTQEIDSESNTLGFFHEWLHALAPKFESIEAICLKEGKHSLPENVRVHTLGKEKIVTTQHSVGSQQTTRENTIIYGSVFSRGLYSYRFFSLATKLRNEYDAVFVHMNQEYVLIAGPLWKLLGKRVYLWRNHYAGSWLTDLAAIFCTKVFCTSIHSYTAKYKKTELMPVGVDVTEFSGKGDVARTPASILFLARFAPSKRPEMLVEALGKLQKDGVQFTASFVGSPLPEDQVFYDAVVTQTNDLGIASQVLFRSGVSHQAVPEEFAGHEIFVNCSRSGMFDKTLFEAAAAGCIVLTSSEDFKAAAGEAFWFADASGLAERLTFWLKASYDERERACERLKALARGESLVTLADRLAEEMR